MKNNLVIAIAREFGSGGREIGQLVAKKLDIPFYDKGFITREDLPTFQIILLTTRCTGCRRRSSARWPARATA